MSYIKLYDIAKVIYKSESYETYFDIDRTNKNIILNTMHSYLNEIRSHYYNGYQNLFFSNFNHFNKYYILFKEEIDKLEDQNIDNKNDNFKLLYKNFIDSYNDLSSNCSFIEKIYFNSVKENKEDTSIAQILNIEIKEISITHDFVTVNFGKFKISIIFYKTSDMPKIMIYPIGNNKHIENDLSDYFHPHVSKDNRICLGDQAPPILKNAIQKGNLFVIVEIIYKILTTYGSSPYAYFSNWLPKECRKCRVINNTVTKKKCTSCFNWEYRCPTCFSEFYNNNLNRFLCSSCYTKCDHPDCSKILDKYSSGNKKCFICRSSFCDEHEKQNLQYCKTCHRLICSSCMRTCTCGEVLCRQCTHSCSNKYTDLNCENTYCKICAPKSNTCIPCKKNKRRLTRINNQKSKVSKDYIITDVTNTALEQLTATPNSEIEEVVERCVAPYGDYDPNSVLPLITLPTESLSTIVTSVIDQVPVLSVEEITRQRIATEIARLQQE